MPRVTDGYLPVPDAPGHGVELNESEAGVWSKAFYLPRELAWAALLEFLRDDGGRPSAVDWYDLDALPDEVFPDPAD